MGARKPTTHRPLPISKTQFALRTGRAKSSITEACGGPLKRAMVGKGRIDVAHPDVTAWARKRGIDPGALLDYPASRGARTDAGGLSPGDGARLWLVEVAEAELLGTVDEVIEEAARYGLRLVYHRDPEGDADPEYEALIDLDHPATLELLSKARGRACTSEDLDRMWDELQRERARDREVHHADV